MIDNVVKYNDCIIFNRRSLNELIKYNVIDGKIEMIKLITEEYPVDIYKNYYKNINGRNQSYNHVEIVCAI